MLRPHPKDCPEDKENQQPDPIKEHLAEKEAGWIFQLRKLFSEQALFVGPPPYPRTHLGATI